MGTLARPPSVSRGEERQRMEPPPPRSGSRGLLLLVAGLLATSLALMLLLARPPLGSAGPMGRVAPSSGYMRPTAGGAVSTGTIVEATEVTATPSRGEPTDVVPSSPTAAAAASTAQALGTGTAVPAASAPSTATPPTSAPAAVQITCAQAQNNVSGEVCVHTTPGAALTIAITYCNGLEAHNTDLQGTRYADSDGNYTWTWAPETTCLGTATAHVTAGGVGGSADASGTFTVNP